MVENCALDAFRSAVHRAIFDYIHRNLLAAYPRSAEAAKRLIEEFPA